MTTGFVATVKSQSGSGWIVTPNIIENDGTKHPDIFVKAQEGITPNIGDKVLVVTMKNNLDFSDIQRVFEASESNGVIMGILQTSGQFKFTGDFQFIGDFTIDGNLSVIGNIEAEGNISTPTGDVIAGSISLKNHVHSGNPPGTYIVTVGAPGPTPVTGTSGPPI